MKAIILHGVGGYAGKHWMQSIHDFLISKNIEVIMPTLQNSENPAYSDWMPVVQNIFQGLSENDLKELIVIGHSMGIPAALEVIQNLKAPIRGLFSAGGFYQDYGSPINTKFMSACNVDIQKAKSNIKNAYVFYGDNDPYVPQAVLSNLAKGLGVDPIIIHKGGHLNTEAGFTVFKEMEVYLQNLLD